MNMKSSKTVLSRVVAVCLALLLAGGTVVVYGDPVRDSSSDNATAGAEVGEREGLGNAATGDAGDADDAADVTGVGDTGGATETGSAEDSINNPDEVASPADNAATDNPDENLTVSPIPALPDDSEPETAEDDLSLAPMATTPVLAPGRYVIRFGASLNRVLDVNGASKADGANVAIWLSHMGGNQIFELLVDSEGYYIIKNVNSGKVLDVAGGAMRQGTNVLQWRSSNAIWQKWIIEKSGSQYVVRSAKDPSFYLDVSGARDANGTNVQIWKKSSGKAQLFDFIALSSSRTSSNVSIADGIYNISSALSSNLVLDVYGVSQANGATVQIYTKRAGSVNQMFMIKRQSDGYYQIRALHSGKALDIENGSVVALNGAVQSAVKTSGGDSQKWAIRDNGDGTVSFYAKVSGLALDVDGNRAKAETRIILYTPHNNKNQRFKLSAVTDSPLSNGIYTISPASQRGLNVDIKGASLSDRGNAIAYADNDGYNQKFKVTKTEDGSFTLQVLCSGLYLTADGTNVCQRLPLGADKTVDATQQWRAQWGYGGVQLVNVGNGKAMALTGSTSAGYDIMTDAVKESLAQGFIFQSASLLKAGFYKISAVTSGNLVEVSEGSTADGAAIRLSPNNGAASQIWWLEPGSNNTFTLRNAKSYKLLDVKGASTASGASVIQWPRNGGSNQRWKLSFGGDGWFIITSTLGTTLSATSTGASGSVLKVSTANGSAAQGFRLIPASGNFAEVRLDVPLLLQLPSYPTGCEAASTAMMLKYAGYNVSVGTVINAMPYHGSDPNKGFVGNPRTWGGYTIYPPALLGVVRSYTGSAVDLTGASAETLRNYLRDGKPVVCWIREGGGLHCIAVTGFDAQNFYYNDPYGGKDKRVSNSTFASMRAGLGNRALSY
jgi:uncharacterized protein YvpB